MVSKYLFYYRARALSLFLLYVFSEVSFAEKPPCWLFKGENICSHLGAEVFWGKTVELHEDDDSVVFHIAKEQPFIHSGRRSEFVVDWPYSVNDRVSYKFQMKLPEGFSPDAKENRWVILAQWHDQPDKNLGEDWKSFPKNNPPVSMFAKTRDGVVGVGVRYLENAPVWIPVSLGEWNLFEFDFLWSDSDKGDLEFKVNEKVFSFQGKNMLNSYQHYFKFGIYRHPDIENDSAVYFRGIEIVDL